VELDLNAELQQILEKYSPEAGICNNDELDRVLREKPGLRAYDLVSELQDKFSPQAITTALEQSVLSKRVCFRYDPTADDRSNLKFYLGSMLPLTHASVDLVKKFVKLTGEIARLHDRFAPPRSIYKDMALLHATDAELVTACFNKLIADGLLCLHIRPDGHFITYSLKANSPKLKRYL